MKKLRPLKGKRILSLCLNLPGPAALQRCRQMGAQCVKLEPPSGDPMQHYQPTAYTDLHVGIRVYEADLKSPMGQRRLHQELDKADVLLTSFRPSALLKLGLDWRNLHRTYPALSQVAIVGAAGSRAEEPGHDLTYQAEQALISGLTLPPSLYADMGGALAASEAVLQAIVHHQAHDKGTFQEIALTDAAAWLALPRHWGLTVPAGAVGGAHAGYRIYACKDGRVAVAALEPHFAAALCAAAGLRYSNMQTMFAPETHRAIAAFLLTQTRRQLDRLASTQDIPLHTLPAD